ncbi:hypothetical protein FGE05_27200 [Pseudomonas sp. ICMP22404]|nr:hypothetical protein FGE05_27200 [Pseudomonas sp. ICMP22404]
MWRGDLSPLGCVAALNPYTSVYRADCIDCLRAATQPSGDESPRHRDGLSRATGGGSLNPTPISSTDTALTETTASIAALRRCGSSGFLPRPGG